jgi:ornithine carbamoyltransferase
MTVAGRRSLISLEDLSDEELFSIVERGVDYASGAAVPAGRLGGRLVGIWFRRTSTRTRTAFTAGALRLGAGVVSYGPSDLQVATGETLEDTGAVLGRMLDAVVTRTAGDPQEMRALAAGGQLSVVNAMSADEHPTQALADLTAMHRRFGSLKALSVLYVGEGNNTAAALALALARVPEAELLLCTPPGYGVPDETLARAGARAASSGARLTLLEDPQRLPSGVDVLYGTRWQTTGTEKADPHWRRVFEPYRIDETMLERCGAGVFMHDLPAHRGDDVTAGVLDGPRSIAFDQAETKMWSAMAVLDWLLGG